jgi:hypothetical protein
MARAATAQRGEARANTRLSRRAFVSGFSMARKIGFTFPESVLRRATEVP